MTQDRLTTLGEMRPRTTLADLGSPSQQTALLERLMADHPDPRPSKRRRRRASAFAGALVLGLAVTPGVAAAIGSGMKPQAFADAYSFWTDASVYDVDASTATRAATMPGPHGGAFTVLTARNSKGLTCVTRVFETNTSAIAKLPDNFEGGMSFCESSPSTKPFGVAGAERGDTSATFYADAGAAVRAVVGLPDGTTYRALLVRGYFFGYIPSIDMGSDRPTLTGYAADGSVVGKARI